MATINPHEKVTSVAQDNWVQASELLYKNVVKLAEKPDQTADSILANITVAYKARQLHILCLTFDDDVEAMRAKCQKFQESQP